MGFSCGIIGLPNVGKSSLFNALLGIQKATAENYPFCTIEPNVGIVPVPDDRLKKLSEISQSEKTINAQMKFVDIAGLVKGASKGEGLGNQFLSNIREVDAIAHVVRCFENDDITHVNGILDPIGDIEIIETELMISDIDTLKKKITKLEREIKTGSQELRFELDLSKKILVELEKGILVKDIDFTDKQLKALDNLNLLTMKPFFFIANVDEDSLVEGNKYSQKVLEMGEKSNVETIIISIQIESEIALLENNIEKNEFMKSISLEEPSLSKLIRKGFSLLNLITFFTSGPKESRAWTISQGTYAPKAAGAIHSDFERGFIAAETIHHNEFIEFNGEKVAREKGAIRTEGKDYIVKDGDVILFRFNV